MTYIDSSFKTIQHTVCSTHLSTATENSLQMKKIKNILSWKYKNEKEL